MRTAAAFVRAPDTADREGEPPGAAGSSGSVERAVHNAYRVLDEQLQRGEETARAYRDLLDRSGISSEALSGLPKGILRLWSEWFGLWLDMLGPFAPPGLRSALRGFTSEPRPGIEPPESRPVPLGPQSSKMSRLTLDVSATKPVQVDIDLGLDTDAGGLVVQDLSAFEGPGKPPITAVKIEQGGDGRLVVRLFVPPDQPPGTYLGMIVDRTAAEQRGTLRVIIRT